MREEFIKNIRVIKKAIADRKLVVFAGAGVSIDSGAPDWASLVDELKKDLNLPVHEADFLRIAQMYFNERRQKEFIDKIRETLKYKKLRYNDIHEAVFDLHPEFVITTNFDDLFEQVIKSKALPFSTIKQDNDFPYTRSTKLLVKIHGDLDDTNLVIKEDDYLNYSNTHPLMESFIKGVFANKVVLFIGYSFSDLNLKMILNTTRNILGRDFQFAYMLGVEEAFHPAQRSYLLEKGIKYIGYGDAGTLYDDSFIEQYLFIGRNALNHEFGRRESRLSKKGQRLLNLIRFINSYMDFAEEIKDNDPVSQISKSLSRFSEVRVLTPEFLANLYPFNNTKRRLYNFKDGVLGSTNKLVEKLFFEEITDHKSLKDDYPSRFSVRNANLEALQKRFEEILLKLNYSSIAYFGRTNSRLELFEYPKDFSEKVNIQYPQSICNCLSCLYQKFKFKEFLQSLNEAAITETSELQNDLLVGYSHYKAANFITAYNLFEAIANKAWQLGKYLSYYIAIQNIKHLRGLINMRWEDSSEESTKAILKKIDDIDLDKLLFQIPALDEDQYKFLKMVRDDQVLNDIEKEIEGYHEKLIEVYDQYKKGGFSRGPYYPYYIRERLVRLFSFYAYNFIIKDEFFEFKEVMKKGVKALFVSYSVDMKYSERLEAFNSLLLEFIIHYCQDKDVLAIINKFNVQEIKVEEDSISGSVQLLCNLFDSIYEETNYYGRNLLPDKSVSVHVKKNSLFQGVLRSKIHNALLLFGCVRLPEESISVVVTKFFNFLAVEDVLVGYSDKYLNHFVSNVSRYFSVDQFYQILRLSYQKKIGYATSAFFQLMAYRLSEVHPDHRIEDITLIKELIEYLDAKDRVDYLFLWKVCNETCRKDITLAIEQSFAKKFKSWEYLHCCHEGIIDPPVYYAQYIQGLEAGLPIADFVDYDPFKHGVELTNFIYMLYRYDLPDESIHFPRFNEYPRIWRFYLKPKIFSYDEFDVRFLKLADSAHIHQQLKKIPEIADAFKEFFKREWDEHLSGIYTKYYVA